MESLPLSSPRYWHMVFAVTPSVGPPVVRELWKRLPYRPLARSAVESVQKRLRMDNVQSIIPTLIDEVTKEDYDHAIEAARACAQD